MKMVFRILVLFIAASAGTWLFADEPHPSLPAAGTLAGLGANIHFTGPRDGELAMLAASGVRWVRMDFAWADIERAPGQYDFSAYERLLAALEAQNLRALFILDYGNPVYDEVGSVVTPQGREAFAKWAAASVAHFQGRGIIWEIWNEPNIADFWKPQANVEQYLAMAIPTAQAMRDAAPNEVIVGPATSGVDLAFLESCFRAGALQNWDAVSVHPYRREAPETVAADYSKLRRLIAKFAPAGKTIPILSGEWGYSAAWPGFDDAMQGRFLARQWLTNLSNNIPISIWYDWHDDGADPREPEHHFGMVGHPYFQGRDPVYDPKPAYKAAQTLTSVLENFHFIKRIQLDRTDDYALLFGRGEKLRLVVWTTADEPREIQIAASDGSFEVVSYTGEKGPALVARNGSIVLTANDEPQYLIAEATNPQLADAPASHPLQAAILPTKGTRLTVRVENLCDTPFTGKVRLSDPSGIEPTVLELPLELSADESIATIRFPLARHAQDKYRARLLIEDSAGNMKYRLPTRQFRFLPAQTLATCRAIADGDPNVASRQSAQVAAPPKPLPAGDTTALQIDYQFAGGWKFLLLEPSEAEQRTIAGHPKFFGFWIYGDQSGTVPRLRVTDATGQTWQPSGTPIDRKGWRYVEMKLDTSTAHWGGINDGKIHLPLTWNACLVLDNVSRKPCAGRIYVGGITTIE